jgi:hypothetical protein
MSWVVVAATPFTVWGFSPALSSPLHRVAPFTIGFGAWGVGLCVSGEERRRGATFPPRWVCGR